ncbi:MULTISPECIES: NAD-dependent epimerase/dehydratase family protein [unclassified Embleya]|uniref:NAD-dependent epimerase/dehydratase family protein n=1 Tax=unclassified Embleya TaxID=2699296 RepID=UPI0036A59D3B
MTPPLTGAKIVVTGATGQVAEPVAKILARDNDVYGAARFQDDEARARLEAAGVTCVKIDLAAGDVAALPADADYVINFAVAKNGDWNIDLDANAGGVLSLMEHHQAARAFLHCSSTAVYQPAGHKELAESASLGDNHGVWSFLETYSICKIAAEGAARWGARRFALPTTIARLSVPYGDNGGWPGIHLEMMLGGAPIDVHTNAPSIYHPIHVDDIAGTLPALLAAATPEVCTVNWGGSDPVSIEEWCGYLAELTGVTPEFNPTDATIDSVTLDLTRMHAITGRTTVNWRDGMRRMVEALHPELLK